LVFLAIILTLAAAGLPRVLTALYAWPRLYRLAEAPARPLAIVFGAGLRRDGSPTPVLRDRVTTAAELYATGRVEKLLMSGTGEGQLGYYNEPLAMRNYAIGLGVPAEDILLDDGGRRTYDTCYRASHLFQADSAILVTQSFHLPRALYTCNRLGVDAIGVPADLLNYRQRSLLFWNLRETAATLVALWEVHISQPQPALSEPELPVPQEAQ
jgi:vancomycin permeability regulator SanA